MIRQFIKIGYLPFVVDLFDAYEDNIKHYEQFVMFRNYEIFNDIFIDKDLYFVDKKIWDDPEERKKITWPICDELGGGFSTSYKYYNGLFSDYGLDKGYDVNILYNKFKHIANVRCNKIRIYRPSIKKYYNNMIIHIDNFINNIHMHYLCKKYEECEIHSSEEFTLNNMTYSEYIEFYVPNVYDLFDNDKLNEHAGCYFKENLNIIDASNIRSEMLFIDNDNKLYFPLDILSLPSTIEQRTRNDITYNIKKYHTVPKSIENNYLTYPVNIILWPYETNIINDKYVTDAFWNIGSSTFISDLAFTLSANLGFYNNKISILSKFIFPNREKFEEKYGDDAVLQAYMKYNNVSMKHYENFSIEAIDKYREELENTILTEEDLIIMKDYYKNKNVKIDYDDHADVREKYIHMKLQSLYDEINEDADTELNFIGFRILIASDANFNHIIYDYNAKIDFKNLDDFAFNLNDIFESWTNVYDGYYVARISFIDRLLGTQIISNSVIISPEWVKFMVNSSNERIINFDNINIDNIDTDNIDTDMTEFNCIENIRCVIHKNSDDTTTVVKSNNAPRLLYRPLFYRASGLQNVVIRRNIKQKIGINLSEYMTKVETFKLLLNGTEYIEYGRNDAFVIFEISGNNFTTTGGMYDILNQDDEYISSGNYALI